MSRVVRSLCQKCTVWAVRSLCQKCTIWAGWLDHSVRSVRYERYEYEVAGLSTHHWWQWSKFQSTWEAGDRSSCCKWSAEIMLIRNTLLLDTLWYNYLCLSVDSAIVVVQWPLHSIYTQQSYDQNDIAHFFTKCPIWLCVCVCVCEHCFGVCFIIDICGWWTYEFAHECVHMTVWMSVCVCVCVCVCGCLYVCVCVFWGRQSFSCKVSHVDQ